MKFWIFVCVAALVLGVAGCAPKPNTEKQITTYLDTRYGASGRFALKEALGNGRYLYRDNMLGVDFLVTSAVFEAGQNAVLPIPHSDIYAHLNRGIMVAHREQAVELAGEHHLLFEPLDSLFTEGSGADESIYVRTFADLDDAAVLMFDLFTLYPLEQVDTYVGGVRFYYCENTEELGAQQNAIPLDNIAYNRLREVPYGVHFPDKEQLAEYLKQQWRAIEKWNDDIPKSQ